MLSSPLPAAAHAGVRELLLGPPRSATAVAVTRAAVVLAVPGARSVCVCSADAVRLPGSLVLGVPTSRLQLTRFELDTPAQVGGGVVRLDDLVVRPARWWSTPRVRAVRGSVALCSGVARLDELAATAPALAGGTVGPALPAAAVGFGDALSEAVGTMLAGHRERGRVVRDRCVQAAVPLLGLGPGLTPSGDDVLAAVLVTVCRLLPETAAAVAEIGQAVAALAGSRTSPLSAALLGWASQGEAVPELLALVDAVGQDGDLTTATSRMLRIGHSSGRDLVEGVRIGARVVLTLLHDGQRDRHDRADLRVLGEAVGSPHHCLTPGEVLDPPRVVG